jgi:hypothetical protein
VLVGIQNKIFKASVDWRFEASGMPEGNSMEEMERNFKEQRDQEFTKHICLSQITNSRASK